MRRDGVFRPTESIHARQTLAGRRPWRWRGVTQVNQVGTHWPAATGAGMPARYGARLVASRI